jgi:hypothetical protein
MAKQPSSATAETDEELEKIHAWRMHVLLEAGVRPMDAEALADSPADLHRMVRAARAGCSSELLREIFAEW